MCGDLIQLGASPRNPVKVNYDDYEVKVDTEKVDDAIHEHLQSRTCIDGHQLPQYIRVFTMRQKRTNYEVHEHLNPGQDLKLGWWYSGGSSDLTPLYITCLVKSLLV